MKQLSVIVIALWAVTLGTAGQAEIEPTGFGQVINLPPTVIGDFETLPKNTQVNLFDGGSIGVVYSAVHAHDPDANIEINVYGGTIGEGLGVMGQAEVNISGGFIDLSFIADSGVTINMSAGQIDTNLTLSGFDAPTVMFLEGGTVGAFLDVDQGATLHFSGGSIGAKLEVFSGGRLNVIGTEFYIDGELLDGLPLDQAVEITRRDGVPLTGTLLDGSTFSIDLNGSNPGGLADVFYGTALLTVTRLEPDETPPDPADDFIFRDRFQTLPEPLLGQL